MIGCNALIVDILILRKSNMKVVYDRMRRSDCHNARVFVGGKGSTHYYVCDECGMPCDAHSITGKIIDDTKLEINGEKYNISVLEIEKTHKQKAYMVNLLCTARSGLPSFSKEFDNHTDATKYYVDTIAKLSTIK